MNLRVPKYVKAEWQVGCSQSKAAAAAPALHPYEGFGHGCTSSTNACNIYCVKMNHLVSKIIV